MKQVIYQVYVGPKTKLYDTCVASVAAYCKRFKIRHEVQTTAILKIKPSGPSNNRSPEAVNRLGYLPIFEKENAFSFLKTNDQVAVIDADIYIKSDAPNIFDELTSEYEFGGVYEREAPITAEYTHKILNYSKMQYGNIKLPWDWGNGKSGCDFMNMGVMVMNKSLLKHLNNETPRQFLARPEYQPFVNGLGNWKWSTDQTLLNTWLKQSEAKIKHLDWRWNALFGALKEGAIEDSYFCHFFLRDKLPNKGENVDQIIKQYKMC